MEAEERPAKRQRINDSNEAQTAELTNPKDAASDPPAPLESEHAEQRLSKNQQKKQKRIAEWEAGREDRKIKRKEKAKEKKERKRAEKHNGTSQQQADGLPKRPHRTQLPVAIVLDCGYDHLMMEKENISLASQITRCYSENCKMVYQPHLYVSGFVPESWLRKRFEGLLKGMYKRWKGIEFVEEDWVVASAKAEDAMKGKWGGKMAGAFEVHKVVVTQLKEVRKKEASERLHDERSNTEELGVERQPQALLPQLVDDTYDHDTEDASSVVATLQLPPYDPYTYLKSQSEVIYLTSDSPHTLTELLPYHTYIIGGIVDKNRHKGLCYKAALDANRSGRANEVLRGRTVKTAKLPIGEYMAMQSRQILATNHVAEIMLKWLECRDWGEAFVSILPKRKGAVLLNEQEAQGEHHDNERQNDRGDDYEDDEDVNAGVHAQLGGEEDGNTSSEVEIET